MTAMETITAPSGKSIVIFADGTGQEGGEGPDTNVYKLFKMVENRTSRQIAFYDRGLGTGYRWLLGKATGAGISENILECYQFLFENYEAGDRIFLFGFSRGAATVRSLSGFIHHFGMLPKSRPELIRRAYKIYKTRDHDERKKKAEDFCAKHHPMWARVRCIGVWDTVAALGVPFEPLDKIIDYLPSLKHSFHDLDLSEGVDHAYHALAIDDRRLTFHPVLWNENIKPEQVMEQVWFCGMHTDVGGGYEKHALSDISLEWMVDKAQACGLLIHQPSAEKIPVSPDANGHMHDSRGTTWTKFFREKERFWPGKDQNGNKRNAPVIHPSVLDRSKNEQNGDQPPYDPWILKLNPSKAKLSSKITEKT